MTRFHSTKAHLKIAVSALIIGTILTGCQMSSSLARPAKYAAASETAPDSGKLSKGLKKAESAVAADPRNAMLRLALADAYMKAGRFDSAEMAYDDSLVLGSESPRAAVSLALMQVANGRSADALGTLEEYRDIIPAGDLGLAMALAGNTKQGVAVLVDEIRGGNSNAKVRQNLALAYALDGRWPDAKVMASQDVPADQVDDRIRSWAMMAKPEDYQTRVATLLGVTPVVDAGMPAGLALANNPDAGAQARAMDAPLADTAAPVRYADASGNIELPPLGEVAQVAVPAYVAPVTAMAPVVAAPLPVVQPPVGPVRSIMESGVQFVSNPVIQAIPVSQAASPVRAPVRTATAPAPKRQMIVEDASYRPSRDGAARMTRASATPAPAPKPAARTVSGGSYIAQLGAFSSADGARSAWSSISARNPGLKSYDMAVSVATVGGKKLHRVAAAGLASKADADALCKSVKARGTPCIVRFIGGGVQGAPKADPAPTRVAARR